MPSDTTDRPPRGVSIVTGAGSGIGAAIAERFAAEGRALLLCDVNEAALERVAERLRDRAATETLAGDIGAPDFAGRLGDALGGRPVAALAHCAGLSASMADAERILRVNLAATLTLLELVPPMLGEGSVVLLIASTAGHYLGDGLDPVIRQVDRPEEVASLLPHAVSPSRAYSISKRAVQMLARRRAAALGRAGARIVSISPGIIDTAMGKAEVAAEPNIPGIVASGALPRCGHAEEVAAAAAFLCSPAASFVTGCDLQVDGGQIAAFLEHGPAVYG